MQFTSLGFAILTYFLGAIPFGVIVTHLAAKTDVRHHGSGNIGATNVARVAGKKWGILVLVLDAFKGAVATYVALRFGSASIANIAAVCALLGHCYPIFLRFKGGKGVATAMGVGLVLSPLLILTAFIFFFAGFLISRRVSVGSLLGALAYGASSLVSTTRGSFFVPAALVIMLLVIMKHRTNIERLLTGREPRFF